MFAQTLSHLRVRPVTEAERPRWNAEVAAHPSLQNATLVGEHLCDVTEYQSTWLAWLGWSAPARDLRPRDAWIGWSYEERAALSSRHAVWSPDGKWLACVQPDESDPAWVDGSYTLNAGWTLIRDGQAFVVLAEKDGWRQAFFGSLGPLSTEEQAAALNQLARTRSSSSTRGRRKMGQGWPQNGSWG